MIATIIKGRELVRKLADQMIDNGKHFQFYVRDNNEEVFAFVHKSDDTKFVNDLILNNSWLSD